MGEKITWASLALLLFVAGYIVMAETSRDPASGRNPQAAVGRWQDAGNVPAPDFALATLDGDTLRLSDLKGRIVVLNFWATWCAPCREETPAFVELHQEFEEQGVQFVGVSVDDSLPPVQAFVEEFGVTYPIVVDDGTAQGLYREITGYPTTYLLNRAGQIERYMPGALSTERLRPVLERIIQAGV